LPSHPRRNRQFPLHTSPNVTLVLKDPTSAPRYPQSALQIWSEGLLYDARDAVFLRVALRSSLLMIAMIAVLYWRFSWWMAPCFWAGQVYLTTPVVLMLHNTMHRPFIRKHRWLNRAVPGLMSALFGIPTGYMEHHVAMHHVENNLPDDLSSTMAYRRDSFPQFLLYFARFMLFSHVELWGYLHARGRGALARRAIFSDLLHMTAIAGLCFLRWQPAVVAFLVPYVTVRFLMMFGNWGQHAFIDPADPGDSHLNSITCVNTTYNARCFNDGYHIGHHIKQNRHWTELPEDLLVNAERYRARGSIVFDGLDFFSVAVSLFLHRYDWLARHFVRLRGDSRSDAEVMAFLKSRTAPIVAPLPSAVSRPVL
jgi:fatty acid desaturase